jgi:hypothetical protein
LVHAGALIDNLAGDGVNAIFARGFAGEHYVKRATDAAMKLLEITGHGRALGTRWSWSPLGTGVRRRRRAGRAPRHNLGAGRLSQCRRPSLLRGRCGRSGNQRSGVPTGRPQLS